MGRPGVSWVGLEQFPGWRRADILLGSVCRSPTLRWAKDGAPAVLAGRTACETQAATGPSVDRKRDWAAIGGRIALLLPGIIGRAGVVKA